jgi:predicted lipid-binding transport protein (Tim44 family)
MEIRKMRLRKVFSIMFLLMFLAWTIPSEALARRGGGMSGGGSFGSRGSRSMTPVKPYTPPASPGVRPSTPAQPGAPSAASPRGATPSPAGGRSSFLQGLGGGILGGLAGSMLGGWLFGGGTSAQAASGAAGGSGFGLMDFILLGGIGLLIYLFIAKRRREQAATALPGVHQSSMAGSSVQPPYYELEPPPASEPERDLENGLRHIEQLDPLFNEDRFKDQAMDFFFKIQGAWADRDMATVKHLLSDEMFRLLQEDAAKMRQDGMVNRLENIAVREVNLTEAWQESGQDYIMVRIYATLLDYTINEKTGEIVEGSKAEPVKFEEYWTLVRPVGNNPWQLSAINQPE